MIIKEVKAETILDSRRDKTILVSVNGCKTSAPSGKSTGKHEKKPYFGGVEDDVAFINKLKIKERINGFNDLKKIEKQVSSKIGANTLFALEASILKALAFEKKKELWQIINSKAKKFPRILSNTIGGGVHSQGKKPDFQEFLLTCNKNPRQASIVNKLAHGEAKFLLKSLSSIEPEKNDENAWTSNFDDERVLEVMKHLQENVFEETITHIDIGVDMAASQFYGNDKYHYKNPRKILRRREQIEYIIRLAKKYNLFYIEDPLEEDDFSGFAKIKRKTNCLIVSDDLTVTNFERVKKAIKMKAVNAVIIKPNQTGSLLEVKKIIDLCKKNKIYTIMSHRSGETLDDTIADLAFAFQCDFIKIPVVGMERAVKIRRLVEIENSLGKLRK